VSPPSHPPAYPLPALPTLQPPRSEAECPTSCTCCPVSGARGPHRYPLGFCQLPLPRLLTSSHSQPTQYLTSILHNDPVDELQCDTQQQSALIRFTIPSTALPVCPSFRHPPSTSTSVNNSIHSFHIPTRCPGDDLLLHRTILGNPELDLLTGPSFPIRSSPTSSLLEPQYPSPPSRFVVK
jgi:hypothetical protein